ncbi:DsrE family protein [Kangiella shandongensis]|uniref:DsrE family protein n=1 Tax=Kangiella shandongensis TaxID=2763258 RepID=UPI001CBD00FC|nr:DsrE family protein [Kangiella shandongensis]
MYFGIILETNDPEQAWNGLRFANTAQQKGHVVKLFLMGAGVEVERINGEKFNASAELEDFVANGGLVLACGTCIKSRNQDSSELCPLSTMNDCVEMVKWADKTVTF